MKNTKEKNQKGTKALVICLIIIFTVHISASVNFSTKAVEDLIEYSKEEVGTAIFADVTNLRYQWAQKGIEGLNDLGIIKGTGNNAQGFPMYSPGEGVKRSEFAGLIARGLDISEKNKTSPFDDMNSEDWFYAEVTALYNKGILIDLENDTNTFRPDEKITRQDIFAIIFRVLQQKKDYVPILKKEEQKILSAFSDEKKIAAYAKNAAAYVIKAGIIDGYEDFTLRPDENVRRAEVAKIICKLFFSDKVTIYNVETGEKKECEEWEVYNEKKILYWTDNEKEKIDLVRKSNGGKETCAVRELESVLAAGDVDVRNKITYVYNVYNGEKINIFDHQLSDFMKTDTYKNPDESFDIIETI